MSGGHPRTNEKWNPKAKEVIVIDDENSPGEADAPSLRSPIVASESASSSSSSPTVDVPQKAKTVKQFSESLQTLLSKVTMTTHVLVEGISSSRLVPADEKNFRSLIDDLLVLFLRCDEGEKKEISYPSDLNDSDIDKKVEVETRSPGRTSKQFASTDDCRSFLTEHLLALSFSIFECMTKLKTGASAGSFAELDLQHELSKVAAKASFLFLIVSIAGHEPSGSSAQTPPDEPAKMDIEYPQVQAASAQDPSSSSAESEGKQEIQGAPMTDIASKEVHINPPQQFAAGGFNQNEYQLLRLVGEIAIGDAESESIGDSELDLEEEEESEIVEEEAEEGEEEEGAEEEGEEEEDEEDEEVGGFLEPGEEDAVLNRCLDVLDALCSDRIPQFYSLEAQMKWNATEAQRRHDENFSFVGGAAFRERLCTRMAAVSVAPDAPANTQRFIGRRAARRLVQQFATWTTNVRFDPLMAALDNPDPSKAQPETLRLHLQDFPNPTFQDPDLYLDSPGSEDDDSGDEADGTSFSQPIDVDDDEVSVSAENQNDTAAAIEQAVDEHMDALRTKLEATLLPDLKKRFDSARWNFLRSNPAIIKKFEQQIRSLEVVGNHSMDSTIFHSRTHTDPVAHSRFSSYSFVNNTQRLDKQRLEVIDSLFGTRLSEKLVTRLVSMMGPTFKQQIPLQYEINLVFLPPPPAQEKPQHPPQESKKLKKPAESDETISLHSDVDSDVDSEGEDAYNSDDHDFIDDGDDGDMYSDSEEARRRRAVMMKVDALVQKTLEGMKKLARRLRPRLEHVPGEEDEEEEIDQKQNKMPYKRASHIDLSDGESSEGDEEEDEEEEEEEEEEEDEDDEDDEETPDEKGPLLVLDDSDSDSNDGLKDGAASRGPANQEKEAEAAEAAAAADREAEEKGSREVDELDQEEANMDKDSEEMSGKRKGSPCKGQKAQGQPPKRPKRPEEVLFEDSQSLRDNSQGLDDDDMTDEDDDNTPIDLPEDLQAAQVDDPRILQLNPARIGIHPSLFQNLKPHQIDGIRFLWHSVIAPPSASASGAILAHSMGLGKSLQIVTLIHTYLTKSNNNGRVLLLAPKVTLDNWMNEFSKWTDIPSSSSEEDAISPLTPVLIDSISKQKAYDSAKTWRRNGGIILMTIDLFKSYVGAKAIRKNASDKAMTEFQEKMAKIFHQGCDLFVLDEGHAIKNPKSANYVAVSGLETRRRILLTGTPLQNNTLELYHLVKFVYPVLEISLKNFKKLVADPIAAGQEANATPEQKRKMRRVLASLRKTLGPCMHRKGSEILVAELQPKHELVVRFRMTSSQEHTYKKVHAMSVEARLSWLLHQILLQKVTCHPDLLISSEAARESLTIEANEEQEVLNSVEGASKKKNNNKKKQQQFEGADEADDSVPPSPCSPAAASSSASPPDALPDVPVADDDSMLPAAIATSVVKTDWKVAFPPGYEHNSVANSSKLAFLFALLDQCAQKGDQVLVFSQYVQVLQFIMSMLANRTFPGTERTWTENTDHFILHGQLSSDTRSQRLKEFTRPGSGVRVFFISTKAGGIGINLVSANRVVMMDGHWNPTHTEQALYRAYRYGQTRPVYVYHLVSAGTIDSEIQIAQSERNLLSKIVVDRKNLRKKDIAAKLAEKLIYHPPVSNVRPHEIPSDHDDEIFKALISTFDPMIQAVVTTDSLYRPDPELELDVHAEALTPAVVERMLAAESFNIPAPHRNASPAIAPAASAGAVGSNTGPLPLPVPLDPSHDVLDFCIGEMTMRLVSYYRAKNLSVPSMSKDAAFALQTRITSAIFWQPINIRWKKTQGMWQEAMVSHLSANRSINAEFHAQKWWRMFQTEMIKRNHDPQHRQKQQEYQQLVQREYNQQKALASASRGHRGPMERDIVMKQKQQQQQQKQQQQQVPEVLPGASNADAVPALRMQGLQHQPVPNHPRSSLQYIPSQPIYPLPLAAAAMPQVATPQLPVVPFPPSPPQQFPYPPS